MTWRRAGRRHPHGPDGQADSTFAIITFADGGDGRGDATNLVSWQNIMCATPPPTRAAWPTARTAPGAPPRPLPAGLTVCAWRARAAWRRCHVLVLVVLLAVILYLTVFSSIAPSASSSDWTSILWCALKERQGPLAPLLCLARQTAVCPALPGGGCEQEEQCQRHRRGLQQQTGARGRQAQRKEQELPGSVACARTTSPAGAC